MSKIYSVGQNSGRKGLNTKFVSINQKIINDSGSPLWYVFNLITKSFQNLLVEKIEIRLPEKCNLSIQGYIYIIFIDVSTLNVVSAINVQLNCTDQQVWFQFYPLIKKKFVLKKIGKCVSISLSGIFDKKVSKIDPTTDVHHRLFYVSH